MTTTPLYSVPTTDMSPELADEMRVHLQEPTGPIVLIAQDLPLIEDVRAAHSAQRFRVTVFVHGATKPMYVPQTMMLKIVTQVNAWEAQQELERRQRSLEQSRGACYVCSTSYFDAKALARKSQDEPTFPTTAERRRHNPPFYDRFRKKSRGGYG